MNEYILADAFDTEQLLECVEKLKSGQPVHVPIYDFKTHQRSSDSFRQVDILIVGLQILLTFYSKSFRMNASKLCKVWNNQ